MEPPRESAALARTRPLEEQIYRVEVGIDDALERLRAHGGVEVMAPELAARPPRGGIFMELRDDGFLIHAPFRAGDFMSALTEVGPALEGTLTPTEYGAELVVRVRRLAPTRSQVSKLVAAGVLIVLGIAGMIAAGSAGLAAAVALFVPFLLATQLGVARARRRRQILESLAVVERALGPVARVVVDAPYRKGASPPPGDVTSSGA